MNNNQGKTNGFIPKWIAWEITRRCNLKCIHCRSASHLDSPEGAFSTEEAFSLIDDIASYCTPVLVLTGGEPLLRGDVFEIAAHGTSRGLRMCLATNGTLITDEICGKIKNSGIKMVSLSLDGSTGEVHDDFRQQAGAFDGAIRAANLLRKHGIEFLINSSFTRRNQDEIPKVYRLAKKLGAAAWYLFMIVPTGRGENILTELIPKEDYEEILQWHLETEKAEDEMLMRPTCAPHYYRIVMQNQKKSGEKIKRRSLKFSTGGAKGCVCAQVICFIANDGEVYPCSYFFRSAGNVKVQSFREIWEDSPLFRELRDFSGYKGRCGQCEYLPVCGGCRARADAVLGDYLEEEPFCSYVPKRMRERTT
ncbi:MAG: radical SAM protein [bacterium]